MKVYKRLSDEVAQQLGLTLKKRTDNGRNPKYSIEIEQLQQAQEIQLELKKQTLDKNGKVTSQTFGKRQEQDDIDKSNFLPVSFTTNPFGEGKWVKYDLPKQDTLNKFREVVDALKSEIEPVEPIIENIKPYNDKIINQYTITDYHLGMMAWADESGADWDIKIAEDTLVRFFEIAIAKSQDAEECIFSQIGDFLHWDGLDAVTPASKHLLDVDTRFTKLVRVAIRVIRRVVKMLLSKYKKVNVIMAEGNHDPDSSVWLREFFSVLYENEPRVFIETNPDPYYCFVFGKVCLFYHHGHKKSIKNVESVFVSKFKKEFGNSEFVYAHLGHFHHVEKETNLMLLEQHRTLAAKDSYASRGGYLSGRDAKVITYHKDYGEVCRQTIGINMIM